MKSRAFLLRRRACFPSPSARAPASQRQFLSKNACSSVLINQSPKLFLPCYCYIKATNHSDTLVREGVFPMCQYPKATIQSTELFLQPQGYIQVSGLWYVLHVAILYLWDALRRPCVAAISVPWGPSRCRRAPSLSWETGTLDARYLQWWFEL